MSKNRRSQRAQLPTANRNGPVRRSNRGQLAFAVLSVLVVCGLIGAAVVTVSWDQLFDGIGLDRSSDEDKENYVGPNADLISEQSTYVAEHPDDLEASILLANLLGNTGRLTEAIPIFERVLNASSNDQSTRLSFARALSDGGLRADAELQFKRIISAEPDNQEAHYYVAELYRLWSPPRYQDAAVHYQRVIEIDPSALIADQSRQRLMEFQIGTPGASPSVSSG